MADGDPEGTKYINAAKSCLDVNERETDRMMQLLSNDIEHEFWNVGYEDVFKNAIQASLLSQLAHQHQSNPQAFVDGVIKKAIDQRKKPGLALDVVTEIERKGVHTIPQAIKDIIAHVVRLAGG